MGWYLISKCYHAQFTQGHFSYFIFDKTFRSISVWDDYSQLFRGGWVGVNSTLMGGTLTNL